MKETREREKYNKQDMRSRELKTAHGYMIPPAQQLCNGLARPVLRTSPRHWISGVTTMTT